MADSDVEKIQVIFPEGEARYRRAKVMFGGRRLPTRAFEITPTGEIGFELTLKIHWTRFEVKVGEEI